MNNDCCQKFHLPETPNQSLLLKRIRDYAPISRTRLSDITGIQSAAITRTVNRLFEAGLLTEQTLGDTTGPRRKKGLCLNGDFGYVLGVEYSANAIEGVAVNLAYESMSPVSKKVELGAMPQPQKIDKILEFTASLVKSAAKELPGRCLGIAMLDPGLVDTSNGTTLICSTMDDWSNVPITELLQQKLKLPVMLPHPTVAKLRAVDRLELQGNQESILYIEYGDGIACGLKLHGCYIEGSSNVAGELGHIRVTDTDIPCRCGAAGCLEAVSALPALAKQSQAAIEDGCDSSLKSIKNFNGLDVLKAAANKDRLALRILENSFDYLVRAIAGLANVLDPKIIVLDNHFKLIGDDLLEDLTRNLMKRISVLHFQNTEIVVSSITSHLGSIGGASAVIDESLNPG